MSTENVMEEDTKLTDEQIEYIANDLEEMAKGTELEKIAKFPSNNGIDERSKDEITEEGEEKKVMVRVNPETGEEVIDSIDDEKEFNFEDFINEVNSGVTEFDSLNFSKEDFLDVTNVNNENLILNSMVEDDNGLKEENIETIIEVMNRRSKGEKFNVYKALPEDVRNFIDKYFAEQILGSSGAAAQIAMNDARIKQYKNNIAESVIDEYIQEIKSKKSKHDFAEELASIYSSFEDNKKELANSSIEYTEARNKAYREGADKIEDPEKRKRYLEIMDAIDEALNLTKLKEFAKKCKIKKIELEKYQRAISDFLQKYEDSDKNIYDLNMVANILFRILEKDGYTMTHVIALIIAFIKQVQNYKAEVATEHAYMYYFIYYCVFIDNQKNNFKESIEEVINNLIERNSDLKEAKLEIE